MLKDLNRLDPKTLRNELKKCCGSEKWATMMCAQQPFESQDQLLALADKIWLEECALQDWFEAFDHHPKIGDLQNLEKKLAGAKEWSGEEQSGVHKASKEVLMALAAGNRAYEKKFGYIFIVSATGKTAEEMLELLQERLGHDQQEEIIIAIEEQRKITKIRLKKLLS